MATLRIALLAGGLGGEREVSLKTGSQIYDALDKAKYEITRYDPKTDLRRFVDDGLDKKFDLIFPALHGPYGEDGKIQGLFELLKIPYVFSGVMASAIAMNKLMAKQIADKAGLETIPDMVIEKTEISDYSKIITYIESKFSLPLVIKPMELGSSVGISLIREKADIRKGLESGFSYDKKLILEKYIQGRELTCAVIGQGSATEALPVIEIRPRVADWFDYRAKYETGGSEEICPASIPDEVKNQVQFSAQEIFHAIDCKDLSRIDFIWDEAGNHLYFLEINTIPGMTATSLAPQAAKAAGMDFSAFLDRLIGFNIKLK